MAACRCRCRAGRQVLVAGSRYRADGAGRVAETLVREQIDELLREHRRDGRRRRHPDVGRGPGTRRGRGTVTPLPRREAVESPAAGWRRAGAAGLGRVSASPLTEASGSSPAAAAASAKGRRPSSVALSGVSSVSAARDGTLYRARPWIVPCGSRWPRPDVVAGETRGTQFSHAIRAPSMPRSSRREARLVTRQGPRDGRRASGRARQASQDQE